MVPLGITTCEVDGVSIITLTGRVVFGEDSNALRLKVKSLIVDGKWLEEWTADLIVLG
jgi:hypothetical protein